MKQGTLNFQSKQEDVSDAAILRCKDMRAAIRLCVQTATKEPKEIAPELGISEGGLSRMLSVSDDPRHFPPELLNRLMDICENEIPLRYLALTRNYGLHRLKTAVEIENEKLRASLAAKDAEMAMMMKIVKEMRV